MTYRARRAQASDIGAIVALYNDVTGGSRTEGQHRWEWCDGPCGPGLAWVIEAVTATGARVIGHHGLVPIPMCVQGRRILAGRTENTMVHREFLNKILYLRYEQSFLEEAARQFDVLITTAGSGAPGRLRRKLGYTAVGVYEQLHRPVGLSGWFKLCDLMLAAKLRGRPAARPPRAAAVATTPSTRSVNAGPYTLDVEQGPMPSVLEAMATLFHERQDQAGITVARDIEFLQWRLAANPYLSHLGIAVRRDGRPVAAFVLDTRRVPAVLVDWLVAATPPGESMQILRCVARAVAREGVHLLRSLELEGAASTDRAVLSAAGYRRWSGRRRPQGASATLPQLLARSCRPEIDQAYLCDSRNWHFTGLLNEGL